jgi:hypothetical protein
MCRRQVLLIYGLDLNTEFTYTAQRRAIMSWENRRRRSVVRADSRHACARTSTHRRPGRVRRLEKRAVVSRTAKWLAFGDQPSDRDSYCDVYFPRDRTPATALTFR